jgi:hypothetical protein
VKVCVQPCFMNYPANRIVGFRKIKLSRSQGAQVSGTPRFGDGLITFLLISGNGPNSRTTCQQLHRFYLIGDKTSPRLQYVSVLSQYIWTVLYSRSSTLFGLPDFLGDAAFAGGPCRGVGGCGDHLSVFLLPGVVFLSAKDVLHWLAVVYLVYGVGACLI